jgi:cysteine-rich repeat protein
MALVSTSSTQQGETMHVSGVRCSVAAGVAWLALAAPAVTGAQVVVVPTFEVGRGSFGGHLQDVDIAPTPDGGFLVIWGDYSLTASNSNDHAALRRFTADGVPLGPPYLADTSGHVFDPALSEVPGGGYVAAWQWIGNSDYRFFGQILDAAGVPTGPDFESTLNAPGPVISGTAVGAASGPTLLWTEKGALWSRTVDRGRDRVGGDIEVGKNGYRNDAVGTADGGYVAVWTGATFAGEAPVMARTFDAAGQPRGAGIPVSDVMFAGQVAASPRGGFVVVGPGTDAAGTGSAVWARLFTAAGVPLGLEFEAHVTTPAYLYADAAFDVHGNLYVVWTEYRIPASGPSEATPPFARLFAADGTALGPAVQISDERGVEVRVVRLASGNLANVWYWAGRAWGTITTTCAPGTAVCGDGERVPGCEACDEGAGNSDTLPDACRTSCERAQCGDGIVDAGEQCDDGNGADCDGCDAGCAVEPGVVCGDGERSRACGEECDEGPDNSDAVADRCRTDCRMARCGDGVIDGGELCDDGNTVSCDGCTFDCRRDADLLDADGNGVADACDACVAFLAPAGGGQCAPRSLAAISIAQQARFNGGRTEFEQVETAPSGLGPVFNAASCGECHNHPTIGGSSARSVVRIGTSPDGYTFDPLVGVGGPLLQVFGLSTPGCSVPGEVVPPEATLVAARNTPPLFGLGLIEAIPELQIKLLAERRQRDGVSGRYGSGNGRVGRFGWKAQVGTLHDFAIEAYRDELGITTPFAPVENAPQGGPVECDAEPEAEDDGQAIRAFVEFVTYLAPPPTPERSREARRGRGVFRRLRCDTCHSSRYRTEGFPVAALNGLRKLRIYSDLLLHDMGPGLADGIRQGNASGSEFRTPPLWGVKYSGPYLHDGRAATLAEAITAHGGEAQPARDRFLSLSDRDRGFLIAFLESL